MITLYGFGPNLNVKDPSPFVLKTHFLLKTSNLDFQVKSGAHYLQKAPKGKLPFIEDKGRIITDSFFIERYLKEEYDFDINAHLTEEQRATSSLLCNALEERLYWCVVYFRWAYESNWQIIKKTFFSGIPFPLSKVVPPMARKGTLKAMHGHGLGRHSQEEILQIAEAQLSSLDQLLGEKDYFYNNELSLLDICAYSLLAQILLTPLPSPLADLANQYGNLVRFCENIHHQYYGE